MITDGQFSRSDDARVVRICCWLMRAAGASPLLLAIRLLAEPTEAADSPPDVAPGPTTAPVPYLSADDAIKTMKLPPGFHVEVVASEPLVEHPVAMSFDPDGRIYVVEMRGYMPDPQGTGERQPVGRVSILEDIDGDGRVDKHTTFI